MIFFFVFLSHFHVFLRSLRPYNPNPKGCPVCWSCAALWTVLSQAQVAALPHQVSGMLGDQAVARLLLCT